MVCVFYLIVIISHPLKTSNSTSSSTGGSTSVNTTDKIDIGGGLYVQGFLDTKVTTKLVDFESDNLQNLSEGGFMVSVGLSYHAFNSSQIYPYMSVGTWVNNTYTDYSIPFTT